MSSVAITPSRIHDGYASYTPGLLRVYDRIVLGIYSRFLWRCSPNHLQWHFDRHISSNHLDVGVGTGRFLDRAAFPSAAPQIVLMDMNNNALEHASRRLARYRPIVVQHNALEPISSQLAPFNSISINYLLHCIPGTLLQKAIVFENLMDVLKPGGLIFGATILTHGVPVSPLTRPWLSLFLKTGIMNNEADSLADLKTVLAKVLERPELSVRGMVGLFSGQKRVDA